MPVGHWSGTESSSDWETWDEPRVVSRDVSPHAFMEELCTAAGGYSRFFWTLMRYYFGWWAAIMIVPAIFLDHHRCETRLPLLAWVLYASVLIAMLIMAVLLELSVVQRLGLLKAGEILNIWSERKWQIPLVGTVLWKLDSYTDVVFIFIARDCGSSLWWASLAMFVFGIIFGQLLFNSCFACTDCDHELPASFGFILLDFKLVNAAVQQILPFDPDASHLPVARPVTLRTTGHLICIEKVFGDIAQVSIQSVFLHDATAPQGFVRFSVLIGALHGALSLFQVLSECVKDEYSLQARGSIQLMSAERGPALRPAGSQTAGSGSSTSARYASDATSSSGRKTGSPTSTAAAATRSASSSTGLAAAAGAGGDRGYQATQPAPKVLGHTQEIPDLL
mmetsp:Transcript_101985/g.186855  ORF Transcript_101985/g.186855 Transcript_101985/m.186855 type:complete len:393 (-) Transcript_101985:98-1276(-)